MLQQWIKRGLGLMAAVLAALAAVAGVYWRGRAMGRAQERSDSEARLQARAGQARKEARDVQEKVARSDDDAVADRLKSDWVRIAPPADRD
ncbi:MAG: hypothetical protein J0I68_30065 [Achromobacter sp.]|jgi:hypothetical protein|uniref:Uncharacterized protein n=2 Tax=Pseudomonadota TaxID=1224 RepID=A0A6J5AJQ1_9BURK|nr:MULTISPECIES: hypothetical protein [Achromobacter]MBN9642808.1 hypothetical protein [Achromobacter sp.]MCG2597022.1 hypothetical protein [Achromobacter sp.]MCG2602964.1 hypothetical protein [Achromobacter sp.]CAB3671466.1 hypothetical protein LMG26845_03796 [Achromobacter insuavis]CAB3926687.1 hypothetical protein LMG26846_06196 [Achromobacter insuavis]